MLENFGKYCSALHGPWVAAFRDGSLLNLFV